VRYPAFDNDTDGETPMPSFIAACIAAVVIAVLGAIALDQFQESASVAFTTVAVRL